MPFAFWGMHDGDVGTPPLLRAATAVPEPATWLLMALGWGVVVTMRTLTIRALRRDTTNGTRSPLRRRFGGRL